MIIYPTVYPWAPLLAFVCISLGAIIASLTDGYIVVAFGNGEIVDNFKNKLSAAYSVTVIEVEENIE